MIISLRKPGDQGSELMVTEQSYLEFRELLQVGYSVEELQELPQFKNVLIGNLEVYVGQQEFRNNNIRWQRWYVDHLGDLFKGIMGWARFHLTDMQKHLEARSIRIFLIQKEGDQRAVTTSLLWGSSTTNQVCSFMEEVTTPEPLVTCVEAIEESGVSDIDFQDLVYDERPIAASRNQRKLDGGLNPNKRRRGRPRKIKEPRVVDNSQKKRGRPKKAVTDPLGRKLSQFAAPQKDLMTLDLYSSEGVQTRARRAYIRSQQAGLIFECPEEVAIEGIARLIGGNSN